MINDPLVKTLLTNVVEDESNLPIVQSLLDGIDTDAKMISNLLVRHPLDK